MKNRLLHTSRNKGKIVVRYICQARERVEGSRQQNMVGHVAFEQKLKEKLPKILKNFSSDKLDSRFFDGETRLSNLGLQLKFKHSFRPLTDLPSALQEDFVADLLSLPEKIRVDRALCGELWVKVRLLLTL